MAVTAQEVKELREKTGVGMMECKKALVEAEGDMDKAFEILRERGLAKSQKKADRIAADGVIVAYTDAATKTTALVEINSETDFVAKNEKFTDFAKKVAETVVADKPADVAALLAGKLLGSDRTVEENLNDLILVIGEKLTVRRFVLVEGNVITYIHAGGSVGVAVKFDTDDATAAKPEFAAMGKDVAMQIAAMSPEYLRHEDISAEELANLRAITEESSLNNPEGLPKPIQMDVFNKTIAAGLFSDEDKAAYEEQKNNKFLFNFLSEEAKNALAQTAVANGAEYRANPIFVKATDGRVNKQLKEICLLDQTFVRSDLFEGTVGGYVANVAKTLGADIQVVSYERYAKGEGIEKRADNFADEVAGMMK